MKIALLTSLRFDKHTGARTKATKVYDVLSVSNEVEMLNISIENKNSLPKRFEGIDFSCTDSRIPGQAREVISGLRLLRHINDSGYDFVISYEDWEHVLAFSWISSIIGDSELGIVLSDYRSGEGLRGLILNEWLRKYIYKQSDVLALESKDFINELEQDGIDTDKAIFAPSGVRVNSYQVETQPEDNKQIIFYVGRSSDIEILFDSFEILSDKFSDIELRLAGPEPSDFPNIDKESIEFLGYVEHQSVIKEINKADICVVPYSTPRTAGRPQKLIEYMAAGSCVIATDFKYNTQMVRDGENGIIVQPNSESLAGGIEQALCDPQLRKDLGTQAIEDVTKHYSIEAMEDKFEKVVTTVGNN